MKENEWEDLGEQIQGIVNDAVDGKNYKRLNEAVNEVIAQVLDSGNDALKSAVSGALGAGQSGSVKSVSDYSSTIVKRQSPLAGVLLPNQYYASVNGDRIKGYLKGGLGSIFSVTAVGRVIAYLIQAGTAWGGRMAGFGVGMTILLGIAGGTLLYQGSKETKRCTRFASYRRKIGDKAYATLKDLADAVGKPVKYVLDDVKEMIRKGWFKEGHLDLDESTIMVTDEFFREYQANYEKSEAQRRKTAQQEAVKRKEQEGKASGKEVPPKVQEILDRGNEFLAKIHQCNEEIAGEEMSAKISRMEVLVERIFDRVAEHPESAGELRRMMNYYLPTTVRLLEAYIDLDSEPVQGENILSSKVEIENTIDTLNSAFEKLLDSIFQDTAWDISSDISVLQQMLEGEGLTGSDFSMGKDASSPGTTGQAAASGSSSGMESAAASTMAAQTAASGTMASQTAAAGTMAAQTAAGSASAGAMAVQTAAGSAAAGAMAVQEK